MMARSTSDVVRRAARSFIRGRGADPTTGWGAPAGSTAALLCFDEFQVADVWSASALKGTFQALLSEGCCMVLTSNRAPHELPRHGYHEELFDFFISQLTEACDIVELTNEADYRRMLAAGTDISPLTDTPDTPPPSTPAPSSTATPTTHTHTSTWTYTATTTDSPASFTTPTTTHSPTSFAAPTASPPTLPASLAAGLSFSSHRSYYYPLGAAAEGRLQAHWQLLVADSQPTRRTLQVMFGRQLEVPRSASGVAWFHFDDLCSRPLGAADYIAVAQTFHTVLLSEVPAMSMQSRDKARRFITLVDELYNARTRLVCSAACPPDRLFTAAEESGEDLPIIDAEALQFEGEVEGARLRRDVMSDGGLAPVAASPDSLRAAAIALGGAEERFAFRRAVSRLYEMQSPTYLAAGAASAVKADVLQL